MLRHIINKKKSFESMLRYILMNKNENLEQKLRSIACAILNNKAHPRSFDSIAEMYDETRIVPDLIINKAISSIHDRINLRENRVILDAGIGTGRICSPLSKYNVELVGIDISSKMLRKCQKRIQGFCDGKSGLLQGDVMRLPFKSSSFNIVVLMHVFFLLERWEEAIQEIKRVLKPGGFLVHMGYTNPPRESRTGMKYVELHKKYCSRNNFTSVRNRLILEPLYSKIAKQIYGMRFTHIKKSASFSCKKSIKWTQKLQISEILDVYEKRPYEEYEDAPEEIHRKIMKDLKKWIDQESVGDSEEVKCNFEIRVFKF